MLWDSIQDGKIGGCGTHLLTMNSTKMHLHVENFSPKTNWRLRERLLYNKGYKENSHGIGYEGKRSNQVSTCTSGRWHRRKELHWQRLSLRSEWWATYWVPQHWGLTKGRWDHSIGRLVGLRAVESLDSTHVTYTNASLCQKYGREGGLKLRGWLTCFPWLPCVCPSLSQATAPATLEQGLLTKKKAWPWDTKVAQTLSCILARRVEPLLAIAQVHTRSCPYHWWQSDCHILVWNIAKYPQRLSCSTIVPLRAKVLVLGGWITHLKGKWANSKLNFRASAPKPWNSIPPLIGQWLSLFWEEAPSYIWLRFSHSISSPISHKGNSFQHTRKKDVTSVHVKSSSPNKTTEHLQTV